MVEKDNIGVEQEVGSEGIIVHVASMEREMVGLDMVGRVLVPPGRLERPTNCLEGSCSIL